MKLGSKYDLPDTPSLVIWNANKFTEVNICKVLKKKQWKL